MLIEIESFKEVKANKGPSKPQINIKIDYKGFEVDINSLSGGERDRLDLSFTLSLAEIFGSRMLMLDESISSLDYDNSSNVLEGLKENYKGRSILIVSHQANEGFFDDIVKF
jgi:ABC-type transport system involved in cytochrome bd biosynthesis fused ATPase/permease subunit